MTDYALRPTTLADQDRITALLTRCYATLWRCDYAADVLTPALTIMTQANPALLVSKTYYMAETPDGECIGCGGWTRDKPGSGERIPGTGHIRHFATHPDYLRQGIAHNLMTRCKAEAARAELDRMECFSSLTAVPFYKACGFRTIRTFDIPITDVCQFPCVHMVYDL